MLQVSIMIFVGFGFLMTFLRHYSYSAVGFNFFASCLVMLEAILALGFTQQASDNFWNIVCCKAQQPALEGSLHKSLLTDYRTSSLQSPAQMWPNFVGGICRNLAASCDAPAALQQCPRCAAALHRLSLRHVTCASP